jgi:HK97 family phage portal protein
LRGDAVAYLARNRAQTKVTSIILWPRDLVSIQRVIPDDPKQPPRLRYYFQALDGYFGAEQEDVLHFPGFGFNGWQSMSVIQWGARAGIGIAIKGDEFAGKFFGQGAQPQFAVKAPAAMTIKQQEDFRNAWVAKYSGNGPSGIPLILTEGLDVTQLTMSSVDAQVIESRQWQVVDIARAFGVPPHMIGETTNASSFGTGIEQMGIGFVKYTLMPHLKRMQQELNHKLFLVDRYYVEFNVDGLMQADAKGRSDYFKSALGGTQSPAWMTPNEVRKLENLPPIDGGDDLSKPKDPTNAQASTAATGG